MIKNKFFALIFFSFLISIFVKAESSNPKCELWIDSNRVVHMKALANEDIGYCYGWAHGRYRAFQMDYFRRVALGRNSEIHGFSSLKGDMMMRLLGFEALSEKIWNQLDPDLKSYLMNYSAGVNNAFAEVKKNPGAEFKLQNIELEEWKPQHSLLVLILQAFDQTRKTFSTEFEENNFVSRWKENTTEIFNSDKVPWMTTIIKESELMVSKSNFKINPYQKNNIENKEKLKLWAQIPHFLGEESGSNSWVINSQKNKEKVAMLANDPHLSLVTPMFWEWIHMQSEEADVIGATLPGVPMVVSGANQKVSWGLTNSYFNTADAVAIDSEDEKDLESFWPMVWVKWHFLKIPIFFKKFQRSQSGFPVLPIDAKGINKKILLKWSGYYLNGKDISFLKNFNKAKSVSEADAILSQVGVPSWNFVYADTQGQIGYRVVGKLLATEKNNVFGIHKGRLKNFNELGELPLSLNPHLINPKRGWIVTANNQQFPSSHSIYGGRAYAKSFRAYRIEELLKNKNDHDVESFKKIQCDVQAVDARFLIPVILPLLAQPQFQELVQELKSWNFQANLDCKICAAFEYAMTAIKQNLNINNDALYHLAVAQNGELKIQLQKEFLSAYQNFKGIPWKEVHLNSFPHISKRNDFIFSKTILTPGGNNTVNPGSWEFDQKNKKFMQEGGASQRFIAVMKKTPELWLSLPGLNISYAQTEGGADNPWQDWSDCKYFKVQWPLNWEQVSTEKIN